MEKITAYKCEFCSKILNTYSGMSKHEKKCFYNPATKSCIICKHLSLRLFINGRIITPHEEELLRYEIDGTYHVETGYMEVDSNVLIEKYKYLYDSEPDNYCNVIKIKLNKLRTNCNNYD